METRNLTMVISNGQTKVAQYGQWDGYPSGNGLTVLKFLTNTPLNLFKKQIDTCVFLSEKEIEAKYREMGINGDMINMEQAERFKKKHPQYDRDMAADVLYHILKGEVNQLQDNSTFAADSLFCEWAYVIDLDKDVLEVYRGFNRDPLTETDRFYPLQESAKDREYKYYPVKLLSTFSLNELPSEEDFLAIDKEVEEES